MGKYDIVFARGRVALEAVASGTACICCGTEGLGEMVTSQNLAWMRRNNFGIRVLPHPLRSETLVKELRRYDAADAKEVSEQVRSEAGIQQAIDQIMGAYQSALVSWDEGRGSDHVADELAVSCYLHTLADDYYRVGLENYRLGARAEYLQAEMDDIHSRTFWKAYVKAARIAWLRRLYLGVVGLFRRRSGDKKEFPGA